MEGVSIVHTLSWVCLFRSVPLIGIVTPVAVLCCFAAYSHAILKLTTNAAGYCYGCQRRVQQQHGRAGVWRPSICKAVGNARQIQGLDNIQSSGLQGANSIALSTC